MKLLIEQFDKTETLIEDVEDSPQKNYFIQGICMQGDIKNRNGRIYPMDVLRKETTRYINENLLKNSAVGELNHPTNASINLDRASHKFTEIREEGTNYWARAKVMSTPMGSVVKNLIDEGVRFGFSSRSLGSLKKDRKSNAMIIQEDLMLITPGDVVHDPSAPDAYIQGIMEGREWIVENGVIKEMDVDQAQNTIRKATSKELEIVKIKVFEQMLRKISKQ